MYSRKMGPKIEPWGTPQVRGALAEEKAPSCMAAQCGYSMESDPWGNTRIYTSLMGCFVDNKVCFELKWFSGIQCNFL